VGYIIVGSSSYGYVMLEAADVPPPSMLGPDELKSTLERDLGLRAPEVGNPARLLYLGFDNLYALYNAGQQEVAVNLIFDFAVAATDLKAGALSPEDYKVAQRATEEAKPKMIIPDGGGSVYNYLDMDPYCFATCSDCNYQNKCWCGPSAGVSIGYYYRGEGYTSIPQGCSLYCELYNCMDTIWGFTDPAWLGPGFVEMTQNHGYDNFNYTYDVIVTGGITGTG
jgi:hypothetical protein